MSDLKDSSIIWAAHGDDNSVADYLAEIIGRPGPRRLAVPGGNTPIPIFENLCERTLPWGKVELILTDDRQVPLTHPASNQQKLEAAFNKTAAQTPSLEAGPMPDRFDCVWLGMGNDGHIASLFPVMEAEDVAGPAVIHTMPDPLPTNAPFARLSLNMEALTNSDAIMLVVRGAEKKRVLDTAIAGGADLPISRLLQRAHCPVTVFWER